MSDFTKALGTFCQVKFGSEDITRLSQLTGGASMESWSFSCADQDMVLRCIPRTADGSLGDVPYLGISLDLQADLIELCFSKGVMVPKVLARLSADDGLGEGFVMAKMSGKALPQTLFRNKIYQSALEGLSKQCARELVSIHNIPTGDLPKDLPRISPAHAITEIEQIHLEIGTQIPVFELAFAWLKANLPELNEPRLVHSDFRMGNLLVDETGLSLVLDWELAHMGDPIRDVAYMCTPSWRFGRYAKEAGGFAALEVWISDYEAAKGGPIDRERFNWWMVYNTLWWGVTCTSMGNAFRDKTVRTLERTIIGRRASEVEIDLLLLLRNFYKIEEQSLDWIDPVSGDVSGEMTYGEISQALQEWNREKIRPSAEGHALFESRIANNALGILQRQLDFGSTFSARQESRLRALKLTSQDLCLSLRQSQGMAPADELWDHLRLTALERLTIDQPKYAGLKAAKEKWSLA